MAENTYSIPFISTKELKELVDKLAGGSYAGGGGGRPETQEEQSYISRFLRESGRLPSHEEAADYMSSAYGTPEAKAQLSYRPGGTMWNFGFRTPLQYEDARSWGLPFGPYAGKDVPYNSMVVKGREGQPFLRFYGPEDERAKGFEPFPQGDVALYPQRPVIQPFNAPKQMTFQELVESDPMGEYKSRVTDYFEEQQNQAYEIFLRSNKKEEDKKKDYYREIYRIEDELKRIAAAIASNPSYGGPSQLPYYMESRGTEGRHTKGMYTEYLKFFPTIRSSALAQYQAGSEYQRSLYEPRWPFGGTGTSAPGRVPPSPSELAADQYRAEYDAFTASLGAIGERSRIWMMQAYPELITIWQQYGLGKPFIEWVREYLKSGGNLPEPERQTETTGRFTPVVRYR